MSPSTDEPHHLPRRSNSRLLGRPPYDAAKNDSSAFNDAVKEVKSTGSIDVAARKLALYAKMTGGSGSSGAGHAAVSASASTVTSGSGSASASGPASGSASHRPAATAKVDPSNSAPPASSISTTKKPSPYDDPEEQGYVSTRLQPGQIEEDDCAVEDEDEDVDMDTDQGDAEEVVHLQEIVEGLWVGDLVSAMDSADLQSKGITNILSLLRPKLSFCDDFAVFPLEIDDSPDTDILTHLPSCVAWIGEALRRHARSRLARKSSSSLRRRSSVASRNGQSRSPTSPLAGHERDSTPPQDRDVLIRHLPQTRPGGVLIHCQAGMSRSATVAAAYLMTALSLSPDEAVSMIRQKRPVIDPSETFYHQLGLFHSADGRVSLRDRETRQFYMERTTSKFMNRGGKPDVSHMAKYPATPTPSCPPTPTGTHGKRKIRCKVCRRHLAVREHMMDHILEQSPASRPRTPSVGGMAPMTPVETRDEHSAAGQSQSHGQGDGLTARERRLSNVSEVINPLTGLPGAGSKSRQASMSGDRPNLHTFSSAPSRSESPMGTSSGSVPTPRSRSIDTTAAGFGLTAIDPRRSSSVQSRTGIQEEAEGEGEGGGMMMDSPVGMSRSSSLGNGAAARKPSQGQGQSRTFQSADQLYANLPPQLAALRAMQSSRPVINTATTGHSTGPESSPPSSPEKDRHSQPSPSQSQSQSQSQYPPNHPLAHLQAQQHQYGNKHEGAKGAARRMSMLALTPTDGVSSPGAHSPRERRGSNGFGFGGEIATGGPPILVNPKCSGYFVEPLTWMEPFLASGQISGKIVCPNEKCGAKIGNFDWAGVQCGCKEWVTPGFCIARNKVDEVW